MHPGQADVRSLGSFNDHVYLCYSIVTKKQMSLMTQAKKQMDQMVLKTQAKKQMAQMVLKTPATKHIAQLVLKSGAKKIITTFVMIYTQQMQRQMHETEQFLGGLFDK